MLSGTVVLLSACLKEAPVAAPQQSADKLPLITILHNNYAFSLFDSALRRTGLDKTLDSAGPFTVLVPDNDAFASSGISADSLDRMDPDTLRRLISYHIIPSAVPYAAIPQMIDFKYPTLAGPPVYFSVPIPGSHQSQSTARNILHINGTTVNRTDILAANGVIHDLGKVLQYPAATVKDILESTPSYSYFTQGLRQFGLLDQLGKPGPFTVMAVTNDDFIQFGIDSAGIARLDTSTYKKLLFSVDILTPMLFFSTDMRDGPLNASPAYLFPDVLLLFQYDGYNTNYGVVPYNWRQIQGTYVPPYFGNYYIYGDQSITLSDPDHLALNGVVHGVTGMPVYPDSVKLQP